MGEQNRSHARGPVAASGRLTTDDGGLPCGLAPILQVLVLVLVPQPIFRQVQVVAADVQCSNPGRVRKNPSPSSIRHEGAGKPLNALWFCVLGIPARPHRSVPLGPFVAVRVSARMPKFVDPSPILSVNSWAHLLPDVIRFTLFG